MPPQSLMRRCGPPRRAGAAIFAQGDTSGGCGRGVIQNFCSLQRRRLAAYLCSDGRICLCGHAVAGWVRGSIVPGQFMMDAAIAVREIAVRETVVPGIVVPGIAVIGIAVLVFSGWNGGRLLCGDGAGWGS